MPTPAADFRLDGKVALVTGAARGLGAAIALALAQAGADLALGLRDQPSGSPVVAEITGLGRRVRTYQMDMFSLDQVRPAIRQAQHDFGRIDILVNNAGIGEPNLAEVVTERDFDDTLAVNLKGTFFASQEAGRIMIAQNSGCIVNLSSQAGFIALPSESIYCMTKAAISHLTKCLALEWAQYHITVNAVAPTFIRTPGTRKWLEDPQNEQSVLRRIPLGRIGDPVDVAGAVVFLASPAAALVTGATLLIDGGWTIQ